MMWGISKARLECLRSQYAPGIRVELIEMNDRQAPPPGTKGPVVCVDDLGTIHVQWDIGSSLGVTFGEDRCRVIVE